MKPALAFKSAGYSTECVFGRSMLPPASRQVIQRLVLKLLFILIFVHLHEPAKRLDALGQLATLSAAGCMLIAVYRDERVRARELNYWDEACCFGLIACFL